MDTESVEGVGGDSGNDWGVSDSQLGDWGSDGMSISWGSSIVGNWSSSVLSNWGSDGVGNWSSGVVGNWSSSVLGNWGSIGELGSIDGVVGHLVLVGGGGGESRVDGSGLLADAGLSSESTDGLLSGGSNVMVEVGNVASADDSGESKNDSDLHNKTKK